MLSLHVVVETINKTQKHQQKPKTSTKTKNINKVLDVFHYYMHFN